MKCYGNIELAMTYKIICISSNELYRFIDILHQSRFIYSNNKITKRTTGCYESKLSSENTTILTSLIHLSPAFIPRLSQNSRPSVRLFDVDLNNLFGELTSTRYNNFRNNNKLPLMDSKLALINDKVPRISDSSSNSAICNSDLNIKSSSSDDQNTKTSSSSDQNRKSSSSDDQNRKSSSSDDLFDEPDSDMDQDDSDLYQDDSDIDGDDSGIDDSDIDEIENGFMTMMSGLLTHS